MEGMVPWRGWSTIHVPPCYEYTLAESYARVYGAWEIQAILFVAVKDRVSTYIYT